jgi:alpha-L-rhamnosidase
MNSYNHYSFGAVVAWMYNHSLGIQRDEEHPGFKHFYLEPLPDPTGRMKWARGYYDSPYGRIESSWEVKEGSTAYSFTVPPNTTARLFLPAEEVKKITKGGKRVSKVKSTNLTGGENGKYGMELVSGTHSFEVEH